MGLSINLIVHGVPMGHKVFGSKGNDQIYYNSFYGPKWDAPELLKVEIRSFAGDTNSYYTFVKGQNVSDYNGRTGSYFALTLRINAFYADIQNIYSILKAAYSKMCVGVCVKEQAESARYIIQDFQSIESQLLSLEQQIVNYVANFSTESDLVSLNGFRVSSGNSTLCNLLECASLSAIDLLKNGAVLFVSPQYPSTETARIIADSRAEIQRSKQLCQLEVQNWQDKLNQERFKASSEITSLRTQSQQNEQAVRNECNREIEMIKAQYVNFDKERQRLESYIKDLQRQSSSLSDAKTKLERELSLKDRQIQELHSSMDLQGEGQPQSPMPIFNKIGDYVHWLLLFFSILSVGLLGYLLYYIRFAENGGKTEEASVVDYDSNVSLRIYNHDLTDSITFGDKWIVIVENCKLNEGELVSDVFSIDYDIITLRDSVADSGNLSFKRNDTILCSINIPIKK